MPEALFNFPPVAAVTVNNQVYVVSTKALHKFDL
jgi:hypothetical protein